MRIAEALGNDHQYLDHCYEQIKAQTTTEDKIKWRNMLTWNLARHAISEELTVYPAMEKHLGEEGKALTAEDFAQHQTVKESLSTLQSLSPADPKFAPLLEQTMQDLHTHIAHERDHDMPRLEAALSEAESEAIAKSFVRTKQFVPTRSHPDAPTGSVLSEGLAGLLAAPIDKLRDLMESWPEEETGGSEVEGAGWWDWDEVVFRKMTVAVP